MKLFDFFRRKSVIMNADSEKIPVEESSDEETSASLPPIIPPKKVPDSIEDMREWHYKALRRLNKHPENEPFSGILSLEVDMPEFVRFAFINELIARAPFEDSLHLLKKENLKNILRENGLSISGNKPELIDRIIRSIDLNTVMNSDYYTDYYILTQKAEKLIQDSYNQTNNEQYNFYNSCKTLILNYQFDDAYRMICKRYAEMPIPPGLNCNWEKRYYDGLPVDKIDFFREEMDVSNDKSLTASAIYNFISAESTRTICNYEEDFISSIEKRDELRYQSSMLSAKTHLKSYVESKTEEYRFLAAFDINTCPVCAKLDGKIFKVSEAKIGVNCPPMHRSCRCTTVAVINKEWIQRGARSARDENWHSIKVPMSMTYDEWYDKYGQFTPSR